MRTHKKKVLTDSISLSIGYLILKLKGIIFIPIIIATVGLANYGVFVQLLINPRIIIPFITLELGMAFYRYTSKYDKNEIEKLSNDYWTVSIITFLLSIFGALALYFLSPILSRHILDGTALNSLRLSSLLVVAGGLSAVDLKYIQCRKKFKLFSIYEVIYGVFPYIGFVIGIIIKHEIFYGFLLYIIIEIALALGLKIYIVKRLQFVLPSISTLKKFVKYSWALLFSNITGGLLSKVDRYFIGYFLGPASIGMYNIVYSACSFLGIIGRPFRIYFSVYFPKVWDDGKKNKVRERLKEGLIYYFVISMGILVVLVFSLKSIYIFFKEDLIEIDNFELLVLILGLGIIAFGASRFFYQLIKFKEQNYLQLIFQTIGVIINIMLNFWLVQEFGIIGAGIATFISYIAVMIMCNFYLNMNIDFNFLIKVLKISISAIFIMIFLYLKLDADLFHLILNIIIAALIYLILILILRVIRISDIRQRFL